MALSLMSIIYASVTALNAPLLDGLPDSQLAAPSPVRYAQLQIEPEDTATDPRVERARSALAAAYPDTDLSVLPYVKFGLHNMELFQLAASEFINDLGAMTAYENPNLMLRVQSVARKLTSDGESETFGLTLNEGANVIAASRTTVNCQGTNIARPIDGLLSRQTEPKGCLIDSATVSEMFGRLADKI